MSTRSSATRWLHSKGGIHMNVLLDIMLSYRGILVLTMIVIFIVGMVYCRVVTGVGITNIFFSRCLCPAGSPLRAGPAPSGD